MQLVELRLDLRLGLQERLDSVGCFKDLLGCGADDTQLSVTRAHMGCLLHRCWARTEQIDMGTNRHGLLVGDGSVGGGLLRGHYACSCVVAFGF